MKTFISPTTKNLVLDTLGDATNGIIRISIYDNNNTQIGSEQVIAWGNSTSGIMTMTSADIVFSVPAITVINGVILWFYDGSLSTAITHVFEEQKIFNNAGTLTVTDVTLTVL